MDFERIKLLFDVAQTARDHGTVYTNIVRVADEELREINASAAPEEEKQPEPKSSFGSAPVERKL